MKEYHKIQSIFKRDDKTHKFVVGEWSLPEINYLAHNQWEFTEKVDGTNIRVMWSPTIKLLRFGGKSDNAQIPTSLFQRLSELFPSEKMAVNFPSPDYDSGVCLYGEGYGAKIQKGGGNYKFNAVDFVLFDVLIGDVWLKREAVVDISKKLGIGVVPVMGYGDIEIAINMVKAGFLSTWGNFPAEGLVLRPLVELKNRMGHRVITKLKTKDF